MSETGVPDDRGFAGAALTPGRARLIGRGRAVMLGVHSAVLLAGAPVVLLMLALSLFEGGDLAFKSRLRTWALVAIWGNVACAVLLAIAAVGFYRGRPVDRGLVRTASALLLGLATGWAWVFQGGLITDPTVLCVWVVLTAPALIAFGIRTGQGSAGRHVPQGPG